jgi:MarR family transcriptional regulator, organic hydroperoxide resistance regulator
MAIDTAGPAYHAIKTSPYPCLCAAVRKVGRILTKRYDRYLRPSGLKITQFSMLANIARNPAITVSALAKLLFMDQTTVSRNLQVLEKSGYVYLELEPADLRIKRVQITEIGTSKIDEARPLWEKAQLDVQRSLGRQAIEGLLFTFEKMAG